MKIFLIIIGSLYACTTLYNLLAIHACANKLRRQLFREHPEYKGIIFKHSFSEIVVSYVPLFIPVFHLIMAICLFIQPADMMQAWYTKVVKAYQEAAEDLNNQRGDQDECT